ncbi:hypothetical protein K431DRAFT_47299 [Polychaeton citri CBS 116435]|uniref:Uncharacterized protein n=1 Tax=Polychaeton citri CBS 116435 TaxID=1314669 RepID=A0A9P4QAW2_9PEZI|nr:hypothetical protein K431DRAFT_47299 [Polychaeton citri CBS 116435]
MAGTVGGARLTPLSLLACPFFFLSFRSREWGAIGRNPASAIAVEKGRRELCRFCVAAARLTLPLCYSTSKTLPLLLLLLLLLYRSFATPRSTIQEDTHGSLCPNASVRCASCGSITRSLALRREPAASCTAGLCIAQVPVVPVCQGREQVTGHSHACIRTRHRNSVSGVGSSSLSSHASSV